MFSRFAKTSLSRLSVVQPQLVKKMSVPILSQHAAAFSTKERPFRILGVQQIAIGAADKEGLNRLWFDIFGLKSEHSFQSEKENVDEDILRLGAARSPFAVEIDLMTPLDIEKSPKVRSCTSRESL